VGGRARGGIRLRAFGSLLPLARLRTLGVELRLQLLLPGALAIELRLGAFERGGGAPQLLLIAFQRDEARARLLGVLSQCGGGGPLLLETALRIGGSVLEILRIGAQPRELGLERLGRPANVLLDAAFELGDPLLRLLLR